MLGSGGGWRRYGRVSATGREWGFYRVSRLGQEIPGYMGAILFLGLGIRNLFDDFD